MKISQSSSKISNLRSDLLVLVVGSKEFKSAKPVRVSGGGISFAQANSYFDGLLKKELKRRGFDAKPKQTALVQFIDDPRIKAVLVFGAPDKSSEGYDLGAYYRSLGFAAFSTVKSLGAKKLAVSGANLSLDKSPAFESFYEALELSGYEYTKYQAKKPKTWAGISDVQILQAKKLPSGSSSKVRALVAGTKTARDLVNMPPNDCNPPHLVKVCRALARKKGLKVQVFDRARLRKMKAFSLLSVAQGSDLPPYLIKLTYKSKLKRPKVISIVGKGITFDTGGNSIKPSAGMMDMKFDMGGAAAVIGAMEAIAALKPKHEVRAYIPTCENMINGSASRPGDVVKAMNGKSIEILNTDAEGRLILADALCMAEKDGADVIVDLATLTGACMVGLGAEYAGLYSTKDEVAKSLISAGEDSGERLWHMPLAPEYKSQIKSTVADIKNIGGSWGGSITAALFLNEFVSKTPWAHIDIAGPAWAYGNKGYIKKGGVGFGVRTIARYVDKFSGV